MVADGPATLENTLLGISAKTGPYPYSPGNPPFAVHYTRDAGGNLLDFRTALGPTTGIYDYISTPTTPFIGLINGNALGSRRAP